MNNTENKLLEKNCPICGKIQTYGCIGSFNLAVKKNRKCGSCCMKGRHHSEETKKKISNNQLGEKNHRYGKPTSEEIKRKLSLSLLGKKSGHAFSVGNIPWNKGKKNCFSEETRIKISSSAKEKKLSSKTKYKLRLAAINRIKKQGIFRSYNSKACETINNYGKKLGYNFQHALNGGEVELYGYFVDGYDKDKNIVFEYDEPHHYQINGKLRNKDLQRQKEIIKNIKPHSFIRYDERNSKLYNVITNGIISETV